MPKIIPIYDKVLIKLKPVDKKTAGGILLPEEHHAKLGRAELRATVIRMGPIAYADLKKANQRYPKEGDEVLVPKYAGQAYGEDGDIQYDTRIINPEEILAILEDDDND